MQINKPQELALSTRVIEYRKKMGLCISASLFCPFDQEAGIRLWTEQTMWKVLSEEMTVPLIDEGVTKSIPEFLVHGYAYTQDENTSAVAVKAKFAQREKTLLVFGERHWLEGKPTTPQPFKKMPLTWDRAYGGADFNLNLVGRGRAVKEGVQWLPNIEQVDQRIIRPDQVVRPAGFGVRDVMHPERVAHRGTYDGSYLVEHSPGFPPDTNWRYFNLAPQDQWLENSLRGNEAFSFENMHPEKSIVAGELPGLKARAFAAYGSGKKARKEDAQADNALVEVPMRLTTVWFFPHLEASVLIFQGLAETAEDDASDIVELLGAVESLNEEKTPQHYRQVGEDRKDPRLGAVRSLDDSPLLPINLLQDDPRAAADKAAFADTGYRAAAQLRRAQSEVALAQQKAREIGIDPSSLNLTMPQKLTAPSLKELPAYLEKANKEIEAAQWDAVEKLVSQAENLIALQKEHGKNFISGPVGKLGQIGPIGPPTYKASAHFEEIQAQMLSLSPEQKRNLLPQLQKKQAVERMTYLQSAHLQSAAPRLNKLDSEKLRTEMQIAIQKGMRLFVFGDFTGADFSELDLRGVDFSNAWLESVNFSGSNLSNSRVVNAVLAHANLSNVVAISADFTGANLGKSTLTGMVADNAVFKEAIFEGCDFSEVSMRDTDLRATRLHDAKWSKCDWSGADLQGMIMMKLDLSHCELASANFSAANLIECQLNGVSLKESTLVGCTFLRCNLQQVDFSYANAKSAIFVEACDLKQSKAQHANFSQANLGDMSLVDTQFISCCFDGANLTRADFSKADLRFSTFIGALARRTNFGSAKLAGANLKDAILQHADFRSCDLRKSNLFGSDMSRVVLNADTRLEHALLTRARTYPRLSPEQMRTAQ